MKYITSIILLLASLQASAQQLPANDPCLEQNFDQAACTKLIQQDQAKENYQLQMLQAAQFQNLLLLQQVNK